MCSNNPKLSDYAKKKKKKKKKKSKVNKNKNICFINQDLAGFEPTGKCHRCSGENHLDPSAIWAH